MPLKPLHAYSGYKTAKHLPLVHITKTIGLNCTEKRLLADHLAPQGFALVGLGPQTSTEKRINALPFMKSRAVENATVLETTGSLIS